MDFDETIAAMMDLVGQPVAVSAPWPAPGHDDVDRCRRRLVTLIDEHLSIAELHLEEGESAATQLAELARATRELAMIPERARPFVQTAGVLRNLEELDGTEGRERLSFRLDDNASFILDRETFVEAERDAEGALCVVTTAGAMLLQLADPV